jgi:hypothetical protein
LAARSEHKFANSENILQFFGVHVGARVTFMTGALAEELTYFSPKAGRFDVGTEF